MRGSVGLSWRLAGAVCLSAIGLAMPAQGQKAAAVPDFAPPSVLRAEEGLTSTAKGDVQAGFNQFTSRALRNAVDTGKELHYVLPIVLSDGTIFNPATGRNDKVRLRAYNGTFPAPTIKMLPGQTVRLTLQNKLAPEPLCGATGNTNIPHCFNTTNMHSHGLWISPTGNSDNVLLSIRPGVDFQYEYNVPADHPAGTFWYHPHTHGSTAIQVGSGMAGALLIEGKRPPTMASNGDLDTLLKGFAPDGDITKEVMLIQQIPYACLVDANGKAKPEDAIWTCNEGEVGVVENFDYQFDPKAWKKSGRYTMFNAQVRPEMKLKSGQLYRWRLIDAGVEETVNLRIRKASNPGALNRRAAGAKAEEAEVQKACAGTDVTQFEVAADGLTRGQIFAKVDNNLQPGYRSDVLFVLPEPGEYCVYDDASGTDQVMNSPDNPKVIGVIHAAGGTIKGTQKEFLTEQLLRAADDLPADVREVVQADLRNDLRLTKYIPHQDVTEEEIKISGQPQVDIAFNLEFEVPPTKFLINQHAYDPNRMDHTLILGTAQQWQLRTLSVNHPFHIHVNPFQIVDIQPADPKVGLGDDSKKVYEGMKGTWKDTIMVNQDAIITIRTRYSRYIGQYVLHCHILDHEDQGMMQNVQIVLPDGQGGAQPLGHNH
ncbi:multicopper oxidase family protein [Niveispirillum sp. BGYR6]|uniref:multicopper oxidase family protein n=1 Tax=Niveispirillum sp. BGYR6 TaxID=2971249 RepID=UPI0022B9A973|nr:multicopper oxidase family protein [Niveispirillum sp. BGYR6]MDG5493878.1 multicopper oxidase family protein [Niveispirillum sp. BGYR6]